MLHLRVLALGIAVQDRAELLVLAIMGEPWAHSGNHEWGPICIPRGQRRRAANNHRQ